MHLSFNVTSCTHWKQYSCGININCIVLKTKNKVIYVYYVLGMHTDAYLMGYVYVILYASVIKYLYVII